MSATRTKGRLDCDTGYGDGHIFLAPTDFTNLTSEPAIVRTSAGIFSILVPASGTTTLVVPLSKIIFRYGLQDDFQGQFGSSAAGGAQGLPVGGFTTLTTANTVLSTSVNAAVLNSAGFIAGRTVKFGTQTAIVTAVPDATHITLTGVGLAALAATTAPVVITANLFTTPADVTGPPPYAGTTQFTPVTAPRPKGIFIKEIYPAYQVNGVALTSQAISLTKTVIAPASGAAPVVTTLLTSAANGLAVAVSTTPVVTPIQIPTPAYQTSKYAEYYIEWDLVAPSGSTVNVYGIFVDVGYNFN